MKSKNGKFCIPPKALGASLVEISAEEIPSLEPARHVQGREVREEAREGRSR